ncbi:MAG: replicative DNA helicase [Fastidiosipilaceae bacterium]|jgi:replicative DNA helicase
MAGQIPDMKVPPNNVEAEKSVLGCCMSDSEILNQIMAFLKTEEFYQPNHQIIYEAIRNLSSGGKAVDILTVSDELERTDLLIKAGGSAYVMSLPDAAPLISNAMAYAEVVHQKYLLRQLLMTADEISKMCYTDAEDANALLDLASRKIYTIREQESVSGIEPFSSILSRTINDLMALMKGKKKLRGVPTGYPSLDKLLNGGLGPGTLTILAARPAVGKSALALNIAMKSATLHDVPVVIFSLEMSKEEISNRMLSAQSGIDSRKLKTGRIHDSEWDKVSTVVPVLYAAKIYVDDRTGNTPIEMLSRCRQLKMEGKCGLVVIDYLQLMTPHRRSDSRQQEISEISRSLKIMAKELDVPVIALSQLSREIERRKDSRPVLSDLRESGAIEQDADVVMFLSRETREDDDHLQKKMEDAKLIIAKNRAGSVGTVSLGWLSNYTLFIEPSYLDDPLGVPPKPGKVSADSARAKRTTSGGEYAPFPKDNDVPPAETEEAEFEL